MAIGLVAAAGMALALSLTRFGPGAAGDSTSYLMGAENLLNGNGYSRYSGGYEIRPITGFPPVYSVALAVATSLGLTLLQAGRWLNALIFAANLALVGFLVFWFTKSTVPAAAAGLLFLTRATQLELHSWVMSEPLFILLSLSGICLIAVYLTRQQLGWLIAAAILAALATLTRYAGAALMGAGALGVLIFGNESLRRRLRDGLLFSVASALPIYLWLLRNRQASDTLVNRELSYHAMEPGLIRLFLADLSSWFVPHEVPLPTVVRAAMAMLIAGGLLAAVVFVLARRWVRWRRLKLELTEPVNAPRALPWLLAFYIGGNLAIIWINSTFLDASTTATAPPRYLAPVYVSTVALLCMVVPHLVRASGTPRVASILAAGYAAVLIGFFAADAAAMLRDPLPHLGYTGRRFLWSELVAHLDRVPEQTPLISNNPEMVYILAGRPAYVRPIRFDPYQDEIREDYEQQFEDLEDELKGGGLFVVFDELEPDDRELIERFGLGLLAEFRSARIYGQLRQSASLLGRTIWSTTVA